METGLIRAAAAGVAYALVVFGVGFALGAIRVILVVPRAGPTAAVLLETPLILAASWWLARVSIARFEVRRAVSARLVMGLVAFAVLILAEVTLAGVLFGSAVPAYLASLATLPGAIGLAAQVVFACFPLVQGRSAGPVPSTGR